MMSTTPPSPERAERLVSMYLGDRLYDANEPPGLREAIIDRVAMAANKIQKRGQTQIDHLRSASSSRIPDAYLVDEEVVENGLQEVAAGIRTARALEGVLSEPLTFEYELAHRLAPSAQWALRGEASRVPRPTTRPSVLKWSLPPIPWLGTTAHWPPTGAAAVEGIHHHRVGETEGQPARVDQTPYLGWVQLGIIELQETFASSHPTIPSRRLLIAAGLKADDEPEPLRGLPLSSGPPNLWAERYDQFTPIVDADYARSVLTTAEGPLAALINYEGQNGAPHRYRGIGTQRFSLIPQAEVIALLGLRPERPAVRHVLVDDDGPALVGRVWRGFLIHADDYRPLEPALHGADLLLRADLYDTLESVIGAERLSMGIAVSYSEREAKSDEE